MALAFALVLLVMAALLPATRVLIVFMRVRWPALEKEHAQLLAEFHLDGEDAVARRLANRERAAVAHVRHGVLLSEIKGGAVARAGTFVSQSPEQVRRASQVAPLAPLDLGALAELVEDDGEGGDAEQAQAGQAQAQAGQAHAADK